MLISVGCIAAALVLNGAPVEREIEAKLGPCRATNLTIRGNGATVVFHDACVCVAIEDAANVKLVH